MMKISPDIILTSAILIFVCLFIPIVDSQTASSPVLTGNTFLTHAVEAKFQCTSYGNPTPIIQWKLENSNILQGYSTETVPLGNNVDNVTSTLTFLPIYADNGQRLSCIVSQTGLSNDLSTFVTLTISYSPTVTVATRLYEVLRGNTVTMVCSVQTIVPLSQVFWRKTTNGFITDINTNVIQGSTKYSGVTLSNPSLTIFNVDNSDEGSYTCYALTNEGQISNSDPTTLSIISITVDSTQYGATEGETVTLQCSVSGLSSYSILWYKDNTVVNTASSRFQNGNAATPSLTISPVAIGDAGIYVCSVSSGASSTNSSAIVLSVQVADTISVTLTSTQYTVYTGNSVTINCDVQATSTVSAVYWGKTSGGNTQFIYTSSSTNRYGGGSPSTPSLTIYNVDTSDAGRYSCYALTSSGLTGQSTNAAVLSVIASLATVTVPSLYYAQNVGDTVTLDCNVFSDSQSYTVTWYFNNAVVGVTGRYSGSTFGNPSLTIFSVQTSDAGTYICSATTSGGSRNSSAISLNVLQQVTVTVPSLYYSTTVGDVVTLQCDVNSGTQSYTVTWYFNNAILGITGRYSGSTFGSPSLRITNVQSSDAGSYICSASSSGGTRNSSSITLAVQQVSLATVTVPSLYYTNNIGELVTLECNVYSDSQSYSVTWYFNNTKLSISGRFSGAIFGNPSLTISSVQSSDAGFYICSATTLGGSRNSSAISLAVLQPTTFTIPSLFYSSVVGDDVTLECSINSGTQSYTVTWYFNDAFLTISGRLSGASIGNPSLKITNVQSFDAGSYICSATTSGVSRNSSVISIAVLQPATFTIPDLYYSATTGDDVTLQCSVNSGSETYTVTWYYNNELLGIVGRFSGATYGSPSLNIANVQNSDSGSYICSATTSAGSRNSSVITLAVQEVLPIITVSSLSESLTIGENVTLFCQVSAGNSVYNVTWYYNNSVVIVTGRFSGGNYGNPSLEISNIQLADSGSYICSASNTGGTSNSSAISINVVEPRPVVTVSTFYYQRTVGGSVTLQCRVDTAGQSYSVTWYFNNAVVPVSGRITGGTFQNPSLTITNILSSDAGSYICSASTSGGTSNSSVVTLGVDNPVPTVTIPTNFYSLNVGENITLICIVDVSSTTYSVTWYYNGGFLVNTGRYSGGFYGTPSLTITNAQTSDSGTYICSAATSGGSRNGTSISVNVQEVVPTVTVTQFFYNPTLGDTITLECSVQAFSSVYTVTWYYNSVVRITNTGRYSGGFYGSPSLTISNVQSTDTGSYICSASTTAGSRNSSTISVNVQQILPTVTVSTFFYQPQVGDTLTLDCSVQASGQTYSVTWYYNSVSVVTTNTGRYSGATFGNPALTISNVQSADTGSYICSAATSGGSRNGTTISVNVQQVLPVISVNTNFYQPQAGETVILDCSVQASGQTYTVTWYYNNAFLFTNTGRYTGGAYLNPSLTITNAQPSDTGSYICSAATTAGSRNSTTISLNVQQVIPTVTVTNFFYQPSVAETVTLDCSVQASSQTYSVQWYYNNALLTTNTGRYSGATFGNPSLTITNIQLSDTGSYICSAATSGGSRNGSTISVNVQQVLPVITVTTFFYQPKVAETVTLDCSVQASGQTYTVQWYFNNALLTTNTGRYSGATFGNPSLTIANVQSSDTGSYICSAATSAGIRNGSTISVNVQQSLPVVIVTTLFYQPKVAETVTLDCSVQASGQTYTIQWYYNNALLTTNTGRYSGAAFNNPSLTITNVQPSDTGSYICSAATSAGSRNGSTISVNVQQSLPIVTVTTFFYQPRVTETVTLDCSVQASGQTYTVQWYYNNARLTTNTGRYSGATFGNPSLTITNVQSSDTGTYICSAATSAGSRNGSTISVNVQLVLPTVTVQTFFYQPKLGEGVTMDCSIDASGQSYSVQWYYNNALLTTNSGRYSGGTFGNPSLTITNVQLSDSGSYVCSGSTSAGSRNGSTISLNVQATLPTVTVPSVFYNPRVTDSVILECSVQASGQSYSVQWYYNNAVISTNTGRYSGGDSGNPSLTITNIQTSDSGSYVCSAATSGGSRNSSAINVSVQQIIPTVTVPAVFYNPRVTDSVILECNVQASGQTYTVTWYYNNAILTTNTGRYTGGTFGSPSLTISNVQTSDTGSYICSAATSAGSRNASTISINVQATLPVVSVNTFFYQPKVTEAVTLVCSVQASGQSYSVTWYYNSGILSTNTGRYSGATSGTPSLTITDVQTSDTGSYICSAATAAGSRNSSTITVTVQQILPTVSVSSVFYQPKVREDITLDCTVQASGQTYTVTWYYNNGIISTNIGRYSGGSFGTPSLTISTLQTSDSGSYICSAATAAGSRNASAITVNVQQILAAVTVPVTSYTPTVADSVNLECNVQAYGQSYTVTWYYNNAILPISGRFTGGSTVTPSLSISSLQMSDTGSYICSAVTAAGSRNGTSISLTVQEILPTVTVSQNFYQSNAGESVTLQCAVEAAGLSYRVTWYYNNAILSTNTGRYSDATVGSPSLTISNTQTTDTGSYICSASTGAGTRNSTAINLTVQQSLPTVSVSTNFYQPVIETSVTLNCNVSVLNGISSYTVTWYYNGGILPVTGRLSGGFFGSPSLTISNIQKSDEGSYICSASNVGGSRNSSGITVNVIQYSPQNVIITPSTLTVDEGNSITLTCNATGAPAPTFSWTQGQRSWTGQQLFIPSSTSSDEAVYTCTATNAAGSQTTTASVFVHYVPRVTIPSYSYTGIQGQFLTIPCTYSASPQPSSIIWRKTVNGVTQELDIPGQNNKYSTVAFSGAAGYANLTINNLAIGDAGTYRCSITNSKGTGSSIDTTVTISYPPQNIAISPSSLITEPEFSNVAVTCTADASPAASFTWTHGSEIYTGATLRFDNAPRTRNGVYTCRASNSAGTSTATVYINLQYKPDIIVTSRESSVTTSVGASVTLDCKTDANPVASLFEWTFNGNTFTRMEPELVILVTSQSFGEYRCQASNNLGVSASYLFTVSESASGGTGNIGLSTAGSGYTAGEIAAIVLAVLFIIILVIVIFCCCYYKGVCKKAEAKVKVEPEPIMERKIEIPRFHEVRQKYPSREPSFVSRQDVDVGQIKEEEFEINTTYRLVPPSSTMGGTIISLKDGHTPRANKLPSLEYTYDEVERRKKRRKKKKRHHKRSDESPTRVHREKQNDTVDYYVNGDTYQTVYEDGNLVVEPGFYNDYDV